MMFVGFFFLLLLTGGNISSAKQPDDRKKCRPQDVVEHLNLTKNKDLYTMDRPVLNYKNTTDVYIQMAIRAILDVKETDQTLTTYVWILMEWKNEFIKWKPNDFCGLESIIIPKEALWMPDTTIEEMIEADESPQSPYLQIYSDGYVLVTTENVVVSTCRMHLYKFPFDTQSCNISFKSIMYSDKEITYIYERDKKRNTHFSQELIRTEYAWTFVDLTATNEAVKGFTGNHTRIIYTINMERRSVLYIANFLLPVFFFLCLDMASFLISDTRGEKLSYKVTALLAVTVMQLLLSDILPSSSDRIPLIVIYCLGIFSLMLLSLLETIVVMHLIDKDSTTQDNEPDGEQTLKAGRWNKPVNCFRDEMPSMTKEGSSGQPKVSLALENVSHELEEIEERVSQLRIGKEEKPGYWTRLAKKINRVFAVCYVTAVILFLALMCLAWRAPEK